MRRLSGPPALAILFIPTLLVARPAAAQKDVKYEFAKPEAVKTVEWKVQAKAGFLMTSGNSSSTNGTVGLAASRKEGGNKLTLEGGLAYGKSRTFDTTVDAMNQITALTPRDVETTNNWLAKGRYDRFFTANNSGYVAALAGGDRIAGKSFMGGGQVGYSRQLVKNDVHTLVAELGYDYSHESYVEQVNKNLSPVDIHSARVFVGETLKANEQTGVTASVEALFNLNEEDGAINVKTNGKGVGAFKDTRVVGKLAVSTTVYKSLSVGLGLTVRYDQNPAPRPVPPSAPAGASYGPDVAAFSDTVDTLTEATLTYTFL